MPDLDAAGITIIRDWNIGKIPFCTPPPTTQAVDDRAESHEDGSNDKILSSLSEAFTIDGLFDGVDEAEYDAGGDGREEDIIEEATEHLDPPLTIPRHPMLSDVNPLVRNISPPLSARTLHSTPSKLFTPEELAVLPPDILNRQQAKQDRKKAKRKRVAAEAEADDLTLDFMALGGQDMGSGPTDASKPHMSKRAKRKKQRSLGMAKRGDGGVLIKKADPGAQRQREDEEYGKFLAQMGTFPICALDDSDSQEKRTTSHDEMVMTIHLRLVDIWDESPFHDLAILDPIIPILPRALLKVAPTSMRQDRQEEDRVKHGDGRAEAAGDSPRAGLAPVRRVVDLAGKLPPSGREEFVAVFGLDVGRVLDDRPRDDGEGSPGSEITLLLQFEV